MAADPGAPVAPAGAASPAGAADVLRLARAARGPVVRPGAAPDSYDVTFVHARDRDRPRRMGLFCPALPGGYAAMASLGDGVFAVTVPLPAGTRVPYHFCPEPPEDADPRQLRAFARMPTARWLDRLNPAVDQVHVHGLRLRMVESLLTLPGARAAPADRPRPGVPAGRVTTLSVHSRELGRRKDVVVHHPAAPEPPGGHPVALLLQSNEEWSRPAFLDNAVGSGRVPPFVAVLFSDRSYTAHLTDLGDGPAHTRFVVDELWPELERRCGLRPGPAVVAGFSAGGLAAAALAVSRPDRFDRLAVVSGALHLGPDMDVRTERRSLDLLDRYSAARSLPGRVYLAAGRYEDAWDSSIPELAAALAGTLRGRGVDVRHDTGPTGHDAVSARAYLTDGLGWLLRPG